MVFSPLDVFTTSGSAILTKCWNPLVTKFDPSSFYNWEADNLPLYDLDERTEYLWERMGKPTSSVPGYALVVSADVAATSCFTNVFTTLSACAAAIPDVINAPFLIEVCNFGDLGELRLSNLKCGPRGSIEIINRGFAKAEDTGSISGLNYIALDTQSPFQGYSLASSIAVNPVIGSGFKVSLLEAIYDSSCLSLATRVLSSTVYTTSDSRLLNNFNVFVSKADFATDNRLSVALSPQNSTNLFSDTPTTKAAFKAYEYNATTYDGVNSYDVSVINPLSSTEVIWGDANIGAGYEAHAILYTNKASKVIIENCDVPIYIRNFLVDGYGFTGTSDHGFLVRNSSKVYLDNCASVRNKKSGFCFDNSKVTILRDFISYRNYDFDALGNRLTGPWLNKRKSDLFSTTYSTLSKDGGAGVISTNSEINFSSVSSFELAAEMSGAPFYNGFASIIGQPVIGRNRILSVSRNATGIRLINSKLLGGFPEQKQMSQPTQRQYNLKIESNVEDGIKLDNSILDWDGRLIMLGNGNGIMSNNSVILLDKFTCKYSQNIGLHLYNSKLTYGKNVYRPQLDTRTYQTEFTSNNQHIVANNSNIIYRDASSVYSNYGILFCTSAFAVGKEFSNSDGIIPDIVIDNGSLAYLMHATIDKPVTIDGTSVKGSAIYAGNGSKVILKGSKDYATIIKGPPLYSSQKRKSGVYAGDASLISFEGPTVIGRYAIDALAENNSTINFGPHRRYDGSLDISGFNLTDSANHTVVELHSTRACLVANRGSLINIKDLGDYTTTWAKGSYGTLALLSGVDYLVSANQLEYSPFTSGGSIQFYPNPNDSSHYGPAVANVNMTNTAFIVNPILAGNYYFLNDGAFDTSKQNAFSGVTQGGMCVRATGSSKVNVHNAHFPCSWWNPSGIIYDISGADTTAQCNQLFIWNIADNSQLNVALVSVSGNHPADIGYHGPWGAWTSSTGATFLSGAPAGSPDTGSLSILDYFGQCSANPFGKATFQNLGPFRLYFGIDPAINWMTDTNSANAGFVNQVYAQGYQFSGNMQASGNVSSFYPIILQRNAGGSIVASGFYYASSFMPKNSNKVIVDDSASNLFANAKHCSIDKSGLSKSVGIFFPYTNTFGGDSANSSTKVFGRGFKSSNTFDLERDN